MVLAHNIHEGLRTQDVQISEDVTFDTMLLTPNTLNGLTECGFYKPSPIQLHGIPLGKCGFDLLLEAKSGTGKTAVFTVIALEKLDLAKDLQTIILAPTREIAAQICDVITQIGSKYKNLNVEVVIGGLSVQEDILKFEKKVHVVVASPGRLRHLIQAKHIDVSAVRLLVLDEADKLMDKSFQADINYIFSVLPKEKQVIMSSATYPELLMSVMNKYVQNAQHICPDSTTVLLGIKQLVVTVKSNSNIVSQTQNRFEELLKILSKKKFKQCLIFCNYQVRVRELCKMLKRERWPAQQLHGQQEQTDRLDALKTLQEYKCRILVSTDLAARGIDASNVDLVINFEPPYDWQTYLHRIGRAGRFGSYGIAITILSAGSEELNFKKKIKAIIDLKTLWDEDKFDVDECDPSLDISLSEGIESTDAYNELLNKLTHGDIKSVEQTTSLKTLCDSFEETEEREIESFNDILTSFKLHTFDDCDPSNNEFTSTIKMPTNIFLKVNKELEDSCIKIKDEIELTKENQNPKKSEEENSKTNENHERHLELGYTTSLNKKNNLKQGIDDNNELCASESDESYTNKALLDAGLPLCFTSSKYNKRKPKIHSKCFNDKENKYNTQTLLDSNHKENRNKNNQPPKGRKIYYKQDTCLISDRELISCNKEISSKELQASLKKVKNNNSKNSYNQNKHDRRESQMSDEVESASDIHTKYMIWYNQLKTHTEQIQMSLYIDEMSKI